MRMYNAEEVFAASIPKSHDVLLATSGVTVAEPAKPVWHQALFDQALSIFHGASPAITTPATYEYVSALKWMENHHEEVHNLSLNAIDHMSADVIAFTTTEHYDLTIFDHPPIILIGTYGDGVHL